MRSAEGPGTAKAGGPCCGNCAWGGKADEDGMVECRRFPPEVFVIDGNPAQFAPRLPPSHVCGEHTDTDVLA